ncbi:MAG TPA: glycosyltransferase family 2 protein [Vicinamibacterales bacterium]|nr:glycosyltransferase family 2 protein [Vicinamibacterales bacterium]
MPNVSVTIITKNEAADIADALASVDWADERIVVDSCSTDDTAAIAGRHGARVVAREWAGYVAQKNYAASLARNDWILSLDADERVTPELARNIQQTLRTEPADRGYRMPRVTFYLGRWIRTTDWYPDDQLRLYDRRAAKWSGRYVHEGVSVKGSVGRLRGELEHYAYRDMAEHLATIDHYTTLAAKQMFEEGRRAGTWELAILPQLAFIRNYLLKSGFRDGHVGLVISALNKYYVFLKFAKLRELQLRARD